MNDRHVNIVVRMADKIAKGKCGKKEVKWFIKCCDIFDISLNIPYDVRDEESISYLNELNDIVHLGICSKEILMKMADIAEIHYGNRIRRNRCVTIAYLLGVLVFVGVVLRLL